MGVRYYCPFCGHRMTTRTCCWSVDDEEDEPPPYSLLPARPWEEWSSEHQFLIAVLMERFGGSAEEGELLCRLPWRLRRPERCFGAPEGRQRVSVAEHPCIREQHGWRVRYTLTDLARDAYTAHRRSVRRRRRWKGTPKQLSFKL